MRRILLILTALALVMGNARAGEGEAARSGRFSVMTYNVAGLPEPLSGSRPVKYSILISPLLNDYDIVLTQEDFYYHADLKAKANHPYISPPGVGGTLGDGLARFSRFPFSEVRHVAWEKCHGYLDHGSDCMTPKGYSVATHEIAPGVVIDIYDLHMDAGNARADQQAREAEMEQLIAAIESISRGHAVIVGGDWNLSVKDPPELALINRLLAREGLTESCRAMNCPRERIDRILYRGSDTLKLKAVEHHVEEEKFQNAKGHPLSDHDPVSAVLEWEKSEEK